MDLHPDTRRRIERWIAADPDPTTATELRSLTARDPAGAAALFDGRLGFGTAGLRAALGPGPRRMNRVVVRQTTAGLVRWFHRPVTVVVGYDARHGSADFAADTAEVVARGGGRALVLPGPLPTPVLAHAVLGLGADAGVMITASHNPAADNGYKLYLGDGIQLAPPADREIAAAIDEVAADLEDGPDGDGERRWAHLTGLGTSAEDGADRWSGAIERLGAEVAEAHLEAAVAACATDRRQVRVAYTALHGVGGDHLVAAFERAGFPAPLTVAEQHHPDPDFPTVSFPNPEEAGALDLVVDLARTEGADVVLANDPDADRLAVAVPDRAGADWVRLSGDQVGVLLAHHLLDHVGPEVDGGNGAADRRPPLVASSIVSSRLISALAADRRALDVRTLTGFKWVARPIVDHPDHRYVLGYEEALGYCVGDRVRDKDGVSAALVMAELVAGAREEGRTLWDLLDDLAARHGVHLTGPVTVRFDGDAGLDQRSELMAAAADDPPTELAGVALVSVEDLSLGRHLPPTTGVVWDLADRSRVIVRPSGTEPKLKAYVEVIEDVVDGAVGEARSRAGDRLDRLRDAVSARLTS